MRKSAKNDKMARKARADSLRERIRELTSGADRSPGDLKPGDESPSPEGSRPGRTPKGESPREFIERRMRELAKKK